MLVDTHAHLTDSRLAPEAPDVVIRAAEAGVDWVVTIASDLPDSERAIELARQIRGVYATVGIHPHSAETATEEAFLRLREMAARDEVVAIGETGLDFYYDNAPRPLQIEVFGRHLNLAREMDLPVVVHARSADEEVSRSIREAGWGRGVLHCFSGGPQLLEDALELGWFVSFAGMITFPKWDAVELLRRVPLDRLLVETDSPYLAPVPHRGKRNEPAFVRLVAQRAAELRGEDPSELFAATSENARILYGVRE